MFNRFRLIPWAAASLVVFTHLQAQAFDVSSRYLPDSRCEEIFSTWDDYAKGMYDNTFAAISMHGKVAAVEAGTELGDQLRRQFVYHAPTRELLIEQARISRTVVGTRATQLAIEGTLFADRGRELREWLDASVAWADLGFRLVAQLGMTEPVPRLFEAYFDSFRAKFIWGSKNEQTQRLAVLTQQVFRKLLKTAQSNPSLTMTDVLKAQRAIIGEYLQEVEKWQSSANPGLMNIDELMP